MRIVCPSCATTYEMPATAIGAGGRKVRCSRCATRWRVDVPVADRLDPEPVDARDDGIDTAPAGGETETATAAVAAAAAPTGITEPVTADLPLGGAEDAAFAEAALRAFERDQGGAAADADGAAAVETPGTPSKPAIAAAGPAPGGPVAAAGLSGSHAPTGGLPQDVETIARPKVVVRHKPRPSLTMRLRDLGQALRSLAFRSRTATGISVFLLSLLLPALGVLLREPIVRAIPRVASLYAEIGMPVNLTGLEFRRLNTLRELDNGQPVLVIEGAVGNLTLASLPMPDLRLALRGADGQEIYAWSVQPKTATVPAGDEVRFRSRLTAPPEDAVDVQLRFTEPKTRHAVLP
jgi:predicted Zn finger-like uncharacterized protein